MTAPTSRCRERIREPGKRRGLRESPARFARAATQNSFGGNRQAGRAYREWLPHVGAREAPPVADPQPDRLRGGPRVLRGHVRPAPLPHRAAAEPDGPRHPAGGRAGLRHVPAAQLPDGGDAAGRDLLGRPRRQEGPPLDALREHRALLRGEHRQRLRARDPVLRRLALPGGARSRGRAGRGGDAGRARSSPGTSGPTAPPSSRGWASSGR